MRALTSLRRLRCVRLSSTVAALALTTAVPIERSYANGPWGYCSYPGTYSITPWNNVFALAGAGSAVGRLCQPPAQTYTTPQDFPATLFKPYGYSGFAFLAAGGSVITSSSVGVTTLDTRSSGLDWAYGAWSSGSSSLIASQILLSGETRVYTSGAHAYGLFASSGGSITSLSPLTSITTSGSGADGVRADSKGPDNPVNGGVVAPNPLGSSSVISMNGGSVATNDASAIGLHASGSGSRITTSAGVTVVTKGGGRLRRPGRHRRRSRPERRLDDDIRPRLDRPLRVRSGFDHHRGTGRRPGPDARDQRKRQSGCPVGCRRRRCPQRRIHSDDRRRRFPRSLRRRRHRQFGRGVVDQRGERRRVDGQRDRPLRDRRRSQHLDHRNHRRHHRRERQWRPGRHRRRSRPEWRLGDDIRPRLDRPLHVPERVRASPRNRSSARA